MRSWCGRTRCTVAETLRIAVVYAWPDRQLQFRLEVPAGTSALEAVRLSGLLARVPELDPRALVLGVFGRVVDGAQPLRDGDRVEVQRPLRADPKEVRRQLAAQGRAMGRRRKPAG